MITMRRALALPLQSCFMKENPSNGQTEKGDEKRDYIKKKTNRGSKEGKDGL